jgi:polar amino acid transport system substrate-binding protein
MWLKKNLLKSIASILCATIPSHAYSKEIKIVTAPWEGYTEKDGSGLYFELFRRAMSIDRLLFEIMPWKRAQSQMEAKKYDVILGESADIKHCSYPKWPIDADFYSIFSSREKMPVWPGKSDLPKYRFLWVRGYDLSQLDSGLKAVQEVNDVEEGMRMIAAGRADALIDYDADLREKQIKLKLNPKLFHVAKTNLSGGLIYACFAKQEGVHPDAKIFDAGMENLYKTGELRKIFEKYKRIQNFEKIIEKIGK